MISGVLFGGTMPSSSESPMRPSALLVASSNTVSVNWCVDVTSDISSAVISCVSLPRRRLVFGFEGG